MIRHEQRKVTWRVVASVLPRGNVVGSGPQSTGNTGARRTRQPWHRTPEGVSFAVLDEPERRTVRVDSKGFRDVLASRFAARTGVMASAQSLKTATIYAAARSSTSTEEQLHVRVGSLGDKYYIDIGAGSPVVQVDALGWRFLNTPPVYFLRSPGMQALPTPIRGGSLSDLRSLLNVGTDDFILICAWILAALRPRGPYPVLVLSGPQGSAKSTAAKVLRRLIDPNVADLRSYPASERDLSISALNSHLLSFDNGSGMPRWLSDALCRAASGGGFSTRQLRTDRDEVIIGATKPVLLNGIELVVSAPDLMNRAIHVELKQIDDSNRLSSAHLEARLDALLPGIFGALLNAMSQGLKGLPDVQLDGLPRMADFAEWATACEPAFAGPGEFMAAYRRNAEAAVYEMADADDVSCCLRALMRGQPYWRGTASQLLSALLKHAKAVGAAGLPTQANRLSQHLKRVIPVLRTTGLHVLQYREPGGDRTRWISIENTNVVGASPRSSPSSRPDQRAPSIDDFIVSEVGASAASGDDRDDRDDQLAPCECTGIRPVN